MQPCLGMGTLLHYEARKRNLKGINIMVILLDKHKHPLGFITEKHARKMHEQNRTVENRRYPYTVIAKDLDARDFEHIKTYRIKIDPGSKYTGIAIVGNEDDNVYFYAQIEHRGNQVKKKLQVRATNRRNRRTRETWYRKAKWGNKPVGKDGHKKYDSPRKEGWLPPSIKSVANNIINFVSKMCKLLPITECSFEAVRFDTQLLDNPDISGVEYQQGTLYGIEIKEYLLEKYRHTCQYCGGATGDNILEWEHKYPKSRGGSDSVKNATLACHTCNHKKDDQTPSEWLEKIKTKKYKSKLDETRIECIQNVIDDTINGGSNRYAAWVSSYRRCVEKALFEKFSNVECSSGGRTKFNRNQLGLPKDHHYDALCVGNVPENGYHDLTGGHYLYVKAEGRGDRFLGRCNKCGIITIKYKNRSKRRFGFQNGDFVFITVTRGKKKGTHFGRITCIRTRGSAEVEMPDGSICSGQIKNCKLVQHSDGYFYSIKASA